MKYAVAKGIAFVFNTYLLLCFKTSRFEASEIAKKRQKEQWESHRVCCYQFFHDEFLMNGLLAYKKDIVNPLIVCNDTLIGLAIHYFWAMNDAESVILRRCDSKSAKMARLHQALRTHSNLVIAADYGKPWYKVHPTGSLLAKNGSGHIMAIHIHAKRGLCLGSDDHNVRIPLPFNHYILEASDPINVTSIRHAVKRLANDLDALRRAPSNNGYMAKQ